MSPRSDPKLRHHADDIAAATLFLLFEAASWITGVTLDITGGRIIV